MRNYRTELGQLKTSWTAKVETDTAGNKLIGGFGLAADPDTNTVDAGFNVDTFWIGRLANNTNDFNGVVKTKPFAVIDGKVYMDLAYIKDLTVDTIKIKEGALTEDAIYNNDYVQVLYYPYNESHPEWRTSMLAMVTNSSYIKPDYPLLQPTVSGSGNYSYLINPYHYFDVNDSDNHPDTNYRNYKLEIEFDVQLAVKTHYTTQPYVATIQLSATVEGTYQGKGSWQVFDLPLFTEAIPTQFNYIVPKTLSVKKKIVVTVNDLRLFRFRLDLSSDTTYTFFREFKGNTDWGPAINPTGGALHWLAIYDSTITARLIKR